MMHAELPTLARGIFKGSSSERFKIVIEEITTTIPFRSFFSMSTKLKTTENETKHTKKDGITDPLLTTTESSPSKRLTRNAHNDAVLSDKEKFLKMTREEKRKLYKCGKKYKQLSDIPTWPNFYNDHKDRLRKSVLKKKLPVRYSINEDINQRVSIWKGDITTLEIDAIANAANGSLLGGGGVDGAIHSAAGKKLVAECATLNGCDTGDAKITAGYKLPAKYVIHTVGPIGEKKDLLSRAYLSVLSRLKENNLTSVAIPCISTGIYGYPSEKAVHVALQTVRDFLENDEYNQNIARVIFCLFMPKDVAIYEEQMQAYFPVPDIACTDDKRDLKVENLEDKKKKDKKEDGRDEKMDTEGEDEKDKSEEERMETEEKEEKTKDNSELIKDTKDKTPSNKEGKMNTSENNKSGTNDKVDSVDRSGQFKEKSGQNKHKMTEISQDERKRVKDKKTDFYC